MRLPAADYCAPPSGARHDQPHTPAASGPAGLRWTNRFATLGEGFFTAMPPDGIGDARWGAISPGCTAELGWPADWWQQPGALDVFSGQAGWPGMSPLASIYSGHQFGQWAGQLGDGRALLLGEVDTPTGPREIQLKGAGRTPYSRGADGRAVLRSTVREFLCSEAMAGLGIPTTRALCFTASTLPVRRETMETAAVVTRVAPSFIRFGHFEHFCHHGQHQRLRQLLDFVITHHLPECAEAPVPALALLAEVSRRTARLVAAWQSVGFCHGVMNTDNMSILGLTIDYGPFGFLDAFDPGHICNHSDHQGRYAFGRQPGIAFWNLHALAQALLPLAHDDVDAVKQALEAFRGEFSLAMQQRMGAKLGLSTVQDGDTALIDDLLRLMAQDRCDHTITFRALGRFSSADNADNAAVRDWFVDRSGFDAWAARYTARLRAEASVDAERGARMAATNPKFVLRNHLAETAIRQAAAGDFGETVRLLKVLATPFDEHPDAPATYAALPPDWAQHLEVSCSS